MRVRAVTFLILTILLSACEMSKLPVREVSDIPDQAIEKFTITETQGGKPHWIVVAPTAKVYEDQKKALLTTPVLKFFENGKYISTITAEKGSVDLGTYDMVGEGKCHVSTEKGEELDTSNLKYLSQAQKIVTDDYLTLVKKGSIVHGKGMEANPDLSDITIRHQTTEAVQ